MAHWEPCVFVHAVQAVKREGKKTHNAWAALQQESYRIGKPNTCNACRAPAHSLLARRHGAAPHPPLHTHTHTVWPPQFEPLTTSFVPNKRETRKAVKCKDEAVTNFKHSCTHTHTHMTCASAHTNCSFRPFALFPPATHPPYPLPQPATKSSICTWDLDHPYPLTSPYPQPQPATRLSICTLDLDHPHPLTPPFLCLIHLHIGLGSSLSLTLPFSLPQPASRSSICTLDLKPTCTCAH
eukprot:1148738-Pelagomonas_calceolata.AAC.2